MYPFLFLVLWPGLSLGCDTGVAYAGQTLSLYRSSLANADVALLRSYNATDVNSCLNDCCTDKYGSCSVASFKKNLTAGDGGDNCQLFNCRPVQLCKFVSSNLTDSFTFSSSALPRVLVPSSSPTPRQHASSDNNPTITATSASAATEVDEPIALKNDNTTVKPRKGVVGLEDIFGEKPSGVKPRKGVSGDGETSKSKVKPRKGVGPQPSSVASSERNESRSSQDVVADDLASALERVFEDDVRDKQPLVTSSFVDHPPRTSTVASIRPSPTSTDYRDVTPTSLTTLLSSSAFAESTTSGLLLPSLTTSRLLATQLDATSSVRTPELRTSPVRVGPAVTPSSPTILEHSRLIFQEGGKPESESERKYKSSMHLVLSLVFGLLILVSVLGVVAKRIYDSWMRRHYRRMDFLIDGMYNGYG